MFQLNANEYPKVAPFIESENELSVFSVINGMIPGEIFVNNMDHPTAALIKTCECNYIAGSTNDTSFNTEVSEELDFYDQLTPDSKEWEDIIPTLHKNPYVRKYKRRHYVLSKDNFMECTLPLKNGFTIEKVDLDLLRQSHYENSDKLLDWAANWGDYAEFSKYGTGYFIHNDKVIVSWSLSDCSYNKTIAIGIHTDERYRNQGFGKIVASATVKACFAMGYERIDWLCVESNKGSRAIAEQLGFQYNNSYYSFSSYPPIENINDLSEAEWYEWGEYLEKASVTEDRLIWDALYCFIKSNNVERTIHTMNSMEQKNIILDYSRFKNYIHYLQENGSCSNFISNTWIDFLNTKHPAG